MKPSLFKPSLLFAFAVSCQVPVETGNVEGLGSTFRDLRQHSFSASRNVQSYNATTTPDGSRMTYVLEEITGGLLSTNIYLKSPNSKARQQKTTQVSSDIYPVVSPDGTKIAFASDRNGSYDIFVMNLDSGRAKRQISFSEEHEVSPTWSPDGTRIAYSKLSNSSREWEIWIFDLANGAVTYLVPGVYPSYSPKTNVIAFQRSKKGGGYYSLWTIDDQGAAETEILASQEEGYLTPRWSPDGTKLVFAAAGKSVGKTYIWHGGDAKKIVKRIQTGRAHDLWTINIDGTNLTQLTTHQESDWDPWWSGDGRIYFSSERDGFTNIWSVIPEFVEIGPSTDKIENDPDGDPADITSEEVSDGVK